MFSASELLPNRPEGDLKQRSAWWSSFVMKLIIDNPELDDSIPDQAVIRVFPKEDPELCSYNENLPKHEGETYVFITLERKDDHYSVLPQIPLSSPIIVSAL